MHAMERCEACGIVPVVVLQDAKDALPTANALLAGDIDVMEITMRTAAGLDAIRAVAQECPAVLVGAGTVTTTAQCEACIEAGARFIVSPGFDPDIVDLCLERQVPALPGCVTPTEIMAALKKGIRILKFFPANIYGGLAAMKALSGPFGGVRFIPTGGINAGNMAEYLASPLVPAVGGSWMCSAADISAGQFEKITRASRAARAVVRELRG
ncbi:MAG: bifunctional 4-hydroxy-2-oxoglutarate aldolase/2-dehydro-3-deoxy-phosphogluconate aldolase [Bacillota bacterium]|nr:bifunctional 4-hydroxy-2-oxoglutarate aldolase/2-dehydro-3-deoxy-phosphogluconate aldolase [Bacillota bacterium]